MAQYILDGNILTDLEYPETPAYHTIMDKLESLPDESRVYFSIISAYEYQHGIAKASKNLAENLKKAWLTFLDLFEILPLTFSFTLPLIPVFLSILGKAGRCPSKTTTKNSPIGLDKRCHCVPRRRRINFARRSPLYL